MANADELVEAICSVIQASSAPIPISLMNHSIDAAAAIIGAVVERCAKDRVALTAVEIDPELGAELGLADGKVLEHGGRPAIRWEAGLGRQVRFVRG